MLTRKASFLGLISVFMAGFAFGGEAIANWSAPATWSPAKSRGGLTTMDVTNPLPFIGLAPCRIVDTRGNGAPITGGMFTATEHRDYAVAGICGIPASARALSLNFTITGPGQTAAGFLLAWPTGGAVPPVSTLNWDHIPAQIANAAVVPTNASVSFTVNVSAPTHVIIDINGYYYDGNSTLALTVGEHFRIIADSGGDSAGIFQNKGTSFASNGVLGFASGTTGTTYGVLGLGVSGTAGAVGVRGLQEGTSGATYGVQGVTFSGVDGASGVEGETTNSSGAIFGVKGVTLGTSSAGPAGVLGVLIGDPRPNSPSAGVRGASTFSYGVFGVSRFIGIGGAFVDSAGVALSVGYLGWASNVGVFFQNGLAGTGTKSFVEPHPTDPSKIIQYVSLEGPEAGTYFRGRARFQRGLAAIEPPEDFRMVTDPESLSIQVTPIGDMASVAVVRIGIDRIIVKGSRDVEFFYLVNGVRRAYNHWDPIQENEKFFVPESPEAKLPKYLSEEERGRLIANGTYNADGTVNLETAERLGWAKAWSEREEHAKAAAAANAATLPGGLPEKN